MNVYVSPGSSVTHAQLFLLQYAFLVLSRRIIYNWRDELKRYGKTCLYW